VDRVHVKLIASGQPAKAEIRFPANRVVASRSGGDLGKERPPIRIRTFPYAALVKKQVISPNPTGGKKAEGG